VHHRGRPGGARGDIEVWVEVHAECLFCVVIRMELDDSSCNVSPVRIVSFWSSANARSTLLREAFHGIDERGRVPKGFSTHPLAIALDSGFLHDPVHGDSESFFLS
jgi:hypothetical protein